MSFSLFLFFIFTHVTLLIPSYAFLHSTKYFLKKPELELISSYVLSVFFLFCLASSAYVLQINHSILEIAGWMYLIVGTAIFIKQKLYKKLTSFRFPLLCLFLISLLSSAFVSFSYPQKYNYIPDPEILSNRNYEVFNVKILNLAHTQANDNYVPYRQAQFIVNKSDAGKDCFICEWGVHFFQRTPLMGSVTAGYFIILNEKPPIDYLWSSTAKDPSKTYEKFQIISHVLNSLFILPAFYLLAFFFNKRTAIISSIFLIISPFFLYNSVFSWPKSLVAFFILSMWLLLYENRLRYTLLSGVAGGLAYLTHDLAAFYIISSILLLLTQKRYRDTLVISAVSAFFALPWIITSSLIYKKPSTFALYPFSLDGLPQPGTQKQVIEKFLNTPPREIISIRFDTFFYLMSPYDLIYKLGNQDILKRFWAVSLYSIPGSLGLGFVIPVILGAAKRLVRLDFWILVFTPILLSTAIVGWRGSRAIASLHFAQAVIVLLTGLAIFYILSLKNSIRNTLIYVLFGAQIIHIVFLLFYSYQGSSLSWIIEGGNMLPLIALFVIFSSCCVLLYLSLKKRLPAWMTGA